MSNRRIIASPHSSETEVEHPGTSPTAAGRSASSLAREHRRSMASDVIYPVEELRNNLEALAAVRSLCLAEPEPKAVHRLRTLSRRIEAQLTLLPSLFATPANGRETSGLNETSGPDNISVPIKEVKRLRKELKQLRQGAGEIRDLDVQRKRVEEFAEAKNGTVLEEGNAKSDGEHEGAAVLDAYLEKKRNKVAVELQAHLQKHEGRITEAGQSLLGQVEEASGSALSSKELLARAGSLVSSDALLKESLRRTLTEEELHTARKAAKAARYLAEMMPRNHAVQTAAKRFEALQDAGGAWHDDLELARTAKSVLGKKHSLTLRMLSEQRRNLRLFREALRAEARRSDQPEIAVTAAAA